MPLVCISIIASAFQYGWPPSLMPVTTMLFSPPACARHERRSHRTPDRRRMLAPTLIWKTRF
jgi:hypothetical protein